MRAYQRARPAAASSAISLCADIFPVSAAGVEALRRQQQPPLGRRQGPGGPLPSEIQRVQQLSVADLKSLVQSKGWHKAAGGDIGLAGAGRTREAILSDIVRKLVLEEQVKSSPATPSASSSRSSRWGRPAWGSESSTSSPSSGAAQMLQWLTDSTDLPCSKSTRWGSWTIPLRPVFRYKPIEISGEPCISVVASHEAIPPPDLHLGALPACAKDAERNVELIKGLQVMMLAGTGRPPSGGSIVGLKGRLGDAGLREWLMGVCTSEDTKRLISQASDDEVLWEVQPNRGGGSLTFLGSRLQPKLSASNTEQLSRLSVSQDPSWLMRACVLPPGERQSLVDGELGRLQRVSTEILGTLFPSGWERASSSQAESLGRSFSVFPQPSAVVGGGVRVKSVGKALWGAMTRTGLYQYEPTMGRQLAAFGVVLSRNPSPAEMRQAERTFSELSDILGELGLEVSAPGVASAGSVVEALDLAKKVGAQVVVFFATADAQGLYHTAKRECMLRKAPKLHHLASQWIDLQREKHDFYALASIGLGICGKLGHTPYVLDSDAGQKNQLLVGMDVCHYPDPKAAGQMMHVVAGHLQGSDGGVESSWLYAGHIDGESIPPVVYRTLLTSEACSGRQVTIHRDGRFTDIEKKFLAEHAKEVGVEGGGFTLVEVVKHAAGSPRLYSGRDNAPPGSFLRLSSSEGLLVAGDSRCAGTRNPLLLRVVEQPGGPNVEQAAKDIYRMSLVTYSNLWTKPRLPATTRAADAAAYFHASTGTHAMLRSGESSEALRFLGRQQYWL